MGEACCADHPDTMCHLTCCPCHLDLDKIKPLCNEPKFICKACGRVANKAENLCDPVEL